MAYYFEINCFGMGSQRLLYLKNNAPMLFCKTGLFECWLARSSLKSNSVHTITTIIITDCRFNMGVFLRISYCMDLSFKIVYCTCVPSNNLTRRCVFLAIFSSWVTITMVVPSVRFRCMSISMISLPIALSRFPVGSSARIISG
jgi:hypothetical protein